MPEADTLPEGSSFPRNAVWNCTGVLCDAVVGFLLMPLIVNTLGETNYGLWALVGSMTGCLCFLDLGVRGALGRQLAFHRALGDSHSMSATLSTALALLTGACLITLLAVVFIQLVFFQLFDVAPEHERMVRLSLLLAGCNLALMFPGNAFDATLWAAQRFDRLAQIDSLVSIGRAVLVCLLLRQADGLILLPLIAICGTLAAVVAKVAVTWRAFPELKVGRRFVCRRAFHEIFNFGVWNFIGNVGGQIVMRVPAIVIGAFISPAAVTPYAIAERLVSYAYILFTAATGVLTPKSAAYAAIGDAGSLSWLFLRGGRLCWLMAAFVCGGMCLFGQPFLLVWMGERQSRAWPFVAVLALGALVPLSQSLTSAMLLGIARHQALAIITMAQGGLALLGSLIAAQTGNPLVVCAVFAAFAFLAGAAQAWHGCRSFHVRYPQYVRRAILPALLAGIVPIGIGWWLAHNLVFEIRTSFLLEATAYSMAFAVPAVSMALALRVPSPSLSLPAEESRPTCNAPSSEFAEATSLIR